MANDTSRRNFLRAAAIGAASAATFGSAAADRDATPRKPNVVFLWTDEQRADTMAAYGKTPGGSR